MLNLFTPQVILMIFWGTTYAQTLDGSHMVHPPPHFVPTEHMNLTSLPPCECYQVVEDHGIHQIECRCFDKHLVEIPNDLNSTVNKLSVTYSENLTVLRRTSMDPYRMTLQEVSLGNLPHLQTIEDGTFSNIPNFRTLYITHAPKLKIASGLLMGVTSTKFYSLRISHTGLVEVPDLSLLPSDNIMFLLDLDRNKIQTLSANSIKIKAQQVTINYNEITLVENFAFNGSQIGKLNLQGNHKLRKLQKYAFKGLRSLRELDLSETSIDNLPVIGLEEVEELTIVNTPTMTTIPSIYDLESLKVARLTYPFHCCAFKYPQQHDPQRHALYEEAIKKACTKGQTPTVDTGQVPGRKRRSVKRMPQFVDDYNWGQPLRSPNSLQLDHKDMPYKVGLDTSSPHLEPLIGHPHFNSSFDGWTEPLRGETIDHFEAKLYDVDDDFGTFHPKSAEINNSKTMDVFCGHFNFRTPTVKCFPEPNALNPCEDIMGSSWLRICVWFVVILAVVGNLAVMVVIIFSGGEITVSRFLICNLALADFCMGLYLLLIACMDLHSVGSYFNFAFNWQYGLGCQLAGFLTVFAIHLSIFTLTVVTIERWFAITYAIHLTRRIRIGAAAKTMLAGWVYSFLVAMLPLLGVSNYSSTSICLPMEVNRLADKAYLYSIILINGVAFVLIVFCYAQIYFSLGYETRHSNSRGEMTIAKKMALLVFTDFATWAPIAFFGITALAGYPLIGVTRSKILLVFFYPLNACANPYLYALMTAQYRRDLLVLISRCGFCKKRARHYTITTTLPMSNHSNPVPLLTRSNGQTYTVKSNEIEDALV